MSPPLLKFVSLLLLVVQGVVASSPWRGVCVPVAVCDSHKADESISGCGHDEHGPCHSTDSAAGPTQIDDHALLGLVLSPHDECGCHVHVPVQGSDQFPPKPGPQCGCPDMRAVLTPRVVVAMLDWECAPLPSGIASVDPPEFDRGDEALSLKSTRLLL
jgi:hypothetical protein